MRAPLRRLVPIGSLPYSVTVEGRAQHARVARCTGRHQGRRVSAASEPAQPFQPDQRRRAIAIAAIAEAVVAVAAIAATAAVLEEIRLSKAAADGIPVGDVQGVLVLAWFRWCRPRWRRSTDPPLACRRRRKFGRCVGRGIVLPVGIAASRPPGDRVRPPTAKIMSVVIVRRIVRPLWCFRSLCRLCCDYPC